MQYSHWREPTFVFVKQIPEYDTEIEKIWNEVVSEDLSYAIECANTTGWYVKDDYERWKSVELLKESTLKITRTVEKIYEEELNDEN